MRLYDAGILMIIAILFVSGTGAAVTTGAIKENSGQEARGKQVYYSYEEASYAETPVCIEYEGVLYCD